MRIKLISLVFCLQLISTLAVRAADSTASDPKIAAEQQQVQRIFNSLINGIGKDPAQYTITVEKSDVINAYATLGRKIVVYSALIESLNNEPALTLVIAHELGHIEKHHAVKGAVSSGLISLIKNFFFKNSAIYDGVTYMGSLKYSRSHEEAADIFAINLMNKLYCNTPGKLIFFEKNAANQKSSKLTEYFSTHPLDSTRLEYLHQAITDAGCKV